MHLIFKKLLSVIVTDNAYFAVIFSPCLVNAQVDIWIELKSSVL